MAQKLDRCVQRRLRYAIVDEVDSILIDEARTPLIISGQASEATDKFYTYARLIPRLVAEDDYTIDEKTKSATLTEEGVDKIEKWTGHLQRLRDGARRRGAPDQPGAARARVCGCATATTSCATAR